MSEAKLNFDENTLDKSSGVYDLYNRLYEGMRAASLVDAPSFENPPLTPEGAVDSSAIKKELADYSEILMKNSAYLFANSIVTVIGTGGGGGTGPGVGFVSRNGDSMAGSLSALYGFKAGAGNVVIFETTVDSKDIKWAKVTGSLNVSDNASIDGNLILSSGSIYFGATKSIYFDQNILSFGAQSSAFQGDLSVGGEFHLGDVLINKDGVFYGNNTYYHAGNSNKSDVDWSSCNAHIYGQLDVDLGAIVNGKMSVNGGFDFNYLDKSLLYTDSIDIPNEDGTTTSVPFVVLSSDLHIVGNHGIKIDDSYVIKLKEGAIKTASFSAPGMVMNLGDSDNDVVTKFIALQTEMRDHTGAYCMVSKFGDAEFRNSFRAGCGNAGPSVIYTFYSKPHAGIVIPEEIRFIDHEGPALFGKDNGISGLIPFKHVENEIEVTEHLEFSIRNTSTTSLFADATKPWSATLKIDSEAEFFWFAKPIEAVSYTIKSEKYKTRLIENALFFDDNNFLEGVTDGIRHSGNSYFDASLSSLKFASGFAGYGWAIKKDAMAGGIAATFDELTIRKKMRVYELEVQRISVTNGSLWVSDSCSGDEVRAL